MQLLNFLLSFSDFCYLGQDEMLKKDFLSMCTPYYNVLVVLMVLFKIFSLFLMLNGEQA